MFDIDRKGKAYGVNALVGCTCEGGEAYGWAK